MTSQTKQYILSCNIEFLFLMSLYALSCIYYYICVWGKKHDSNNNDAKPHVNTSHGTISRSDLNPGFSVCTAVYRSISALSILQTPTPPNPISTYHNGIGDVHFIHPPTCYSF